MSIRVYPPSALRRLPKKVGTEHLAALEGMSHIPEACPNFDGSTLEFDETAVRGLFEHALTIDVADPRELEPWLAPRVHAAIRIPRRLAAMPGFWSWLAVDVARDYVIRRHGEEGVVTKFRYYGPDLRNAVARLWWASEILRNGSDYSTVVAAFEKTRWIQFATELRYSWYRPAALAFARYAVKNQLTDEETQRASTTLNGYLGLTAIEARAPLEDQHELDMVWWTKPVSLSEVVGDELPDGPEDGAVGDALVEDLSVWIAGLVADREAN